MKEGLIPRVAGRNAGLYARALAATGSRSRPVSCFNQVAAIRGPIWTGMRELSFLFLLLRFLDLLALNQIVRA